MVINNERDLRNAMKQILANGTVEIANEVGLIIDNFLIAWYGDYDPKKYQRTYQFLNSCVTSELVYNKNSVSIQVYIDTSNLHYDEIDDSGFVIGEKDSEWVVDNADEGIHGTGIYARKGRRPVKFWTDSNEMIHRKKTVLKAFSDYLDSEGISYKIT